MTIFNRDAKNFVIQVADSIPDKIYVRPHKGEETNIALTDMKDSLWPLLETRRIGTEKWALCQDHDGHITVQHTDKNFLMRFYGNEPEMFEMMLIVKGTPKVFRRLGMNLEEREE